MHTVKADERARSSAIETQSGSLDPMELATQTPGCPAMMAMSTQHPPGPPAFGNNGPAARAAAAAATGVATARRPLSLADLEAHREERSWATSSVLDGGRIRRLMQSSCPVVARASRELPSGTRRGRG